MRLTECEKIRQFIKYNAVVIDGDEKNPLPTSIFPLYVLIRQVDVDLENVDDVIAGFIAKHQGEPMKIQEQREETEKLFYTIANNQKLATGATVAFSNGFYVVPIYEGMTEVRYLTARKVKDEKRLYLEKEPLFEIPADTFNQANAPDWTEYPVDIFNDAAYAANAPFCLESTYRFKGDLSTLASCVKCLEIIQSSRIAVGNTITNNAYKSLGMTEYRQLKKEIGCDDMDEDGAPKKNFGVEQDKNSFIKVIYADFKNILKAAGEKPNGDAKTITVNNFNATKLIPNFMYFNWMLSYHRMVQSEDKIVKAIADEVSRNPIYTRYLSGIRGIGPGLAAYLIAYLDPRVCRHPSGFIRYLGLDVVKSEKTGKDIGRNKFITRPMPYLTKDGEVAVNNSRGYNAHIKSKVYMAFDCMIKHKDPKYYQMYLDFRDYYTNRADLATIWNGKDKGEYTSPARMAQRKVMSRFVIDLWLNMRRILGLPLNGGTYEEAKLGIKHNYDYHYPNSRVSGGDED